MIHSRPPDNLAREGGDAVDRYRVLPLVGLCHSSSKQSPT
jgi:hypothetical protein